MGWVDSLRGKTVGLDTAPLIFYIEDHPVFADRLEPFFQLVQAGEIQLVASTVTLLEVLVLPLKQGNERLAHDYNDFLVSSPHVVTLPVSPAIAQTAAELRATTKLRTPDAIQLATALEYRAAAFLTNDRDFGDVRSLKILRIGDLAE